MKSYIVVWWLTLCLVSIVRAADAPSVHLSVQVVAPDGKPIRGAVVAVGGGLITPDGKFPRKANGVTDEEGRFSATIDSLLGQISAFAHAGGFYRTTTEGFRLFKQGEDISQAQKRGYWEPRERTIVLTLRPIKNPVPMYVKRLNVLVPEVGKPVGYDLERGDWVAPYGKGLKTDFEFTVVGHYESMRNYEGALTLRLPGEGNGIQGYELDPIYRSELKLPYEAPESEYQTSWTWHDARRTPVPGRPSVFVNESKELREFIFRVRTVLDEHRNILRANYGKIYGPIYFQTFEGGKSRIGFTYYYNPDGTRNLECDPKRNLFSDQQRIEP